MRQIEERGEDDERDILTNVYMIRARVGRKSTELSTSASYAIGRVLEITIWDFVSRARGRHSLQLRMGLPASLNSHRPT